jgi:hypothetical protein
MVRSTDSHEVASGTDDNMRQFEFAKRFLKQDEADPMLRIAKALEKQVEIVKTCKDRIFSSNFNSSWNRDFGFSSRGLYYLFPGKVPGERKSKNLVISA